jgi:hypothetical protein
MRGRSLSPTADERKLAALRLATVAAKAKGPMLFVQAAYFGR